MDPLDFSRVAEAEEALHEAKREEESAHDEDQEERPREKVPEHVVGRGFEGPRGELGYYVISDEGPSPYRFHIRPPSFINLSALREMTVGGTVADAIVVLGSIDIVVGEIDR